MGARALVSIGGVDERRERGCIGNLTTMSEIQDAGLVIGECFAAIFVLGVSVHVFFMARVWFRNTDK